MSEVSSVASVKDQITTKAARDLVRQMEASIAELLAELMPDAELSEIQRRCRLTRVGNDPGEFFEVDNLPRLYFGPLVVENERQQERYILRVSRQIRRIA